MYMYEPATTDLKTQIKMFQTEYFQWNNSHVHLQIMKSQINNVGKESF